MTDSDSPAVQFLQERKVPFTLFRHSGPIHSLEQAAEERRQRPEQVVRSIVFRLGEGEFVMVLMPGPGQVPWKALRQYLGQSRLSMATKEELLEATGYRPGTVNPFALPHPMRILIDRGVLNQPVVSLGSGRPGLAIMLKPSDLISTLDPVEIVNFSAVANQV